MKVLALLAIIFIQVLAVCPQNLNNTIDSYRKALSLLEEAISAVGGKEVINNVNNISCDLNGIAHARNQSATSGFPSERRKAEVKVVLEVKKDRVYLADKVTQLDGLIFEFFFVAGREAGFNVSTTRDFYTPLPANSPTAGTVYRFVPTVILAKAFEQRATLRWLGQQDFKGKKHDFFSLFLEWSSIHCLSRLCNKIGFQIRTDRE